MKLIPQKFLDTQVLTKNGKTESAVNGKSTKLLVPWTWNIPKRYKRNVINASLHCSKRVSTNFDKEIFRIKKKFLTANYLQKVFDRVIRNFENDKVESIQNHYIIPPGIFNATKPLIFYKFSFLKTRFL